MTDIKLLNDPEYRWNHKDEMSRIMPYTSIRNEMKIKVLDYTELRWKNEEKIKERRSEGINWTRLRELVERVKLDYYGNSNRTKTSFQPADKLHFETRDKGRCYLCDSVYHYGSNNKWVQCGNGYKNSQLHHVIPDGDVSDENIVTLCVHCHQIVHQILYVEGRWRYARPT